MKLKGDYEIMVKHIIFWDHADGLSVEEKAQNAILIKSALEELNGVIPGLVQLNVFSDLFNTSNADIVLDSVFENHDALKAYTDHPAHVKVAVEVVRPRIKNRRCADFEIV